MFDADRPTSRVHVVGLLSAAPVRLLAWLALFGATGVWVRGEVVRSELPDGVSVTTGLVYRESGGRRARLDVLRPDGPAPRGGRPCLVALHGGGWRGGSKSDYGRELAPLVREGLVVVAVDYRLSRPGDPSWPENLDDVREALHWVDENADVFGIDRGRVALIGASAGAHLALLAGFDPAGPVTTGSIARKTSDLRVRAVIDFYGPTDLTALVLENTPAAGAVGVLVGGSVGERPDLYESASPLPRVSPKAPPVLILHGRDDRLVPLDQSRRLAAALGRAGVRHRLVVVDGARHGFGLQAGPRDLTPDLLAFLRTSWKD